MDFSKNPVISFSVLRAKTEKADVNASAFLFWLQCSAHDGAMKNEVAYGTLKCENALRFMQGVSLVLHFDEANASFFIEKT